MVGSSIQSRLRIVGEDEDPDLLARTIGQRRGAADHLVARRGVHAEAEGKLDGFVELGLGELGEDLNRILERVILAEVSDREGAPVSLGLFLGCHVDSLRCERPGGLPR